jgi:hypothetical protein
MADARSAERRGDPNAAALLTWFLPGAGHAYLGRYRAALTVFVVVEGIYALGWWLSQGRVFEFLDPELRGPFATILAPEAANLGAMLAQLKKVGFGPAELSPFPATITWGAMLTAASGLANVVCMADAHLQARSRFIDARRETSPALLVLAAWAVPGLGHWLQGRRCRGLIVCLLLVGFFAWGTWMAEGSNLSRERHFYYWSGQFLLGAPAILAECLSGHPRVTGELFLVDVGLLYACMAGLLNVLALLDVHGVAEQRWLAAPVEPVVPAAPGPADSSEVPA